MAPLIRLENVTKDYLLGEARVRALDAVDLDIYRGEFLAVWGPSGSGKSTLCNLIGLVDDPTEGTLTFDGTDTAQLDDDAKTGFRNSRIGFVFQSFNLLPVLSALENVMLPLVLQGSDQAEACARASELLTDLGLGDHLQHRPQKLSGGQQQRVAIARSLITKPSLVIADEPTANLDSVTAGSIIDLMRDLNDRFETTFVFSTHDQRLLDRVDRKIQLVDGRPGRDEGSDLDARPEPAASAPTAATTEDEP